MTSYVPGWFATLFIAGTSLQHPKPRQGRTRIRGETQQSLTYQVLKSLFFRVKARPPQILGSFLIRLQPWACWAFLASAAQLPKHKCWEQRGLQHSCKSRMERWLLLLLALLVKMPELLKLLKNSSSIKIESKCLSTTSPLEPA